MKILITGANGSIGSDLVSSFSEKHKVYAIYRSSNKVVKKLKNKNITWIKQDIKSKIKLKSKIDVLIHCAFIHEFSKKKTYKDYVSSNIIGLKNIIEFANKKKIKSFIYLSSVTIYGEIKEDSLTDNNKFINPSILGASKILSEKMIEKQKFNYLNLRLPGVISYLNNDYRRPWLNNIIYNLKIGKKITVFNSNLYFNNIIDTVEIFNFINYVIKNKLKSGTLNLSATKPMQIRKMINFLKEKISSKSKINFNNKKKNHFTISLNKLLKNYNYKTSSTKKILERCIKNYK